MAYVPGSTVGIGGNKGQDGESDPPEQTESPAPGQSESPSEMPSDALIGPTQEQAQGQNTALMTFLRILIALMAVVIVAIAVVLLIQAKRGKGDRR